MRKICSGKETIIGFTLAEVLITLTIIGVIAALTIPSLIQNIQNAQLKTAWKKEYSDIAGAVRRVSIDNGGNLIGVFTSNDIFRDKVLAYMSYAKKCDVGMATGPNGCWPDINNWYNLSGGTYSGSDRGVYSRAVLSNGALVTFFVDDIQCQGYQAKNGDLCSDIDVDVNGFRGPNTVGKDIFGLQILKDGTVLPQGTPGDWWYANAATYGCDITANPSSRGWDCSAEYLKQ